MNFGPRHEEINLQCNVETDQDAQKKEAAKAIKKLSQKKLGNAFVALRKIALHPLLTRRVVSEERLTEFAKLARRR